MFKILVVEDDQQISDIIVENIEKQGYSSLDIKRFDDIMIEFLEYSPDLILMDINLPFYDGFYWCGKIRMLSKIPIIFISSRSTDMDIIIAVTMGGDDYIIKPFSIEVLMTKIEGLLRRTYSYNHSNMGLVSHKNLLFSRNNCTIMSRGKVLELTKNELQILDLLLKNRGNVVSRERIIRTLWKNEHFIDDNTLTVNMTRLRKKLNELGLEGFIETKRKMGYMV